MLLMYGIYQTMRVQEWEMELRGSILNDNCSRLKKSRQTTVQGAYYIGAFYVTWSFPTVFQLVLATSGDLYFILLFLMAFLVPIKGLH